MVMEEMDIHIFKNWPQPKVTSHKKLIKNRSERSIYNVKP